jgi:hypothetical protein
MKGQMRMNRYNMIRDEVINIESNCPIFNVDAIKNIEPIVWEDVWEDENPTNTVVGVVKPISVKLVSSNAYINPVALDLMINGTNNWRKRHHLPMRRKKRNKGEIKW